MPVSEAVALPRPATTPRTTPASVLWKRRIAKYARWLHVYVSMASFVVVFFFAVTGLTLNHTEWFEAHETVAQFSGSLDPAWVRPSLRDDVDRLQVAEFVRSSHGIHGAVSDFAVDDTQCTVSFKAPGYTADAFVDRTTGRYELSETRLGFAAIVNDLHKGRDSGPVWKAIIDLSAGLLTFVSLTGLILIYFIHKHRFAGLVSLTAGGALIAIIYAAFVP